MEFVDSLDLQLMILGAGLILITYLVYLTFMSKDKRKAASIKSTSIAVLVLGIYAFILGIVNTITWPLPGPYNIVLSDPYALVGVIFIALGIEGLLNGSISFPISLLAALLSIPVFTYGAAIIYDSLTTMPPIAGGMFILIALAALLSPMPFRFNNKYLVYLIMILLILASITALFIGIDSVFEHIVDFAKWTPVVL